MGKSENYLFFGNYCSLGSKNCLKQYKFMKLNEYQKSRSFFDLGHMTNMAAMPIYGKNL